MVASWPSGKQFRPGFTEQLLNSVSAAPCQPTDDHDGQHGGEHDGRGLAALFGRDVARVVRAELARRPWRGRHAPHGSDATST